MVSFCHTILAITVPACQQSPPASTSKKRHFDHFSSKDASTPQAKRETNPLHSFPLRLEKEGSGGVIYSCQNLIAYLDHDTYLTAPKYLKWITNLKVQVSSNSTPRREAGPCPELTFNPEERELGPTLSSHSAPKRGPEALPFPNIHNYQVYPRPLWHGFSASTLASTKHDSTVGLPRSQK